MARMIDADALIADMEKRYCKDCERRKGVKGGKVRTLYEIGDAPCRACGTMDAMDEIDNASTIEAEPVRHGHWVTKTRHEHYPSGKEYEEDFCSICGKRGSVEYEHCPHCGAKMDEVIHDG